MFIELQQYSWSEMFCTTDKSLSLLTVKKQSVSHPACSSVTTVRVCLYLSILKYPAGRIFSIYFNFYEFSVRLKPSQMQQSLYLCMFLSLCHSSDSSVDGLLTVLDNEQKKNKIQPADIDIK
jgi:hypothetical protein